MQSLAPDRVRVSYVTKEPLLIDEIGIEKRILWQYPERRTLCFVLSNVASTELELLM